MKTETVVKTEGDTGPSAVSMKIDQFVKKGIKPWTDQETLLLLEVGETVLTPATTHYLLSCISN